MVPHVFRHTGPSNDRYHQRRSIAEVRRRGRWGHEKSVSRYDKPGRMLQVWSKIREQSRAQLMRSSLRLDRLIIARLLAIQSSAGLQE